MNFKFKDLTLFICSLFRVTPGELRAAVSGLEVLHYDESIEITPEDDRVESGRVVARSAALNR